MRSVLVALAFVSATAFADPKDDFVNAVVEQCKLAKDQAEALATPGRTGTVVQFALCASSTIKASDSCSVVCKKSGNNIGG